MKWIVRGAIAVVVLAVAALLHYSLPSTQVLRITDVESRFMGQGGGTGDGETDGRRDVSFIYAAQDEGDAKVFRNEDTGFGFPPYFKFNSETLAARAQDIASADTQEERYAYVTSYGWRLELFSMFPNVTGVEPAEPGDSHFPLFNIVFLVVLGGLVGYVVFWFRGRAKRRERRREQEAAEAAARTAAAERQASEDLASGLNRKGDGDSDDPWRS